MIMGKNILAIIPARIGSKGIVKKNLKKIKKKSLIAHAILCLQKIKQIYMQVVHKRHLFFNRF